MGKDMGIPVDKRGLLQMKNEFLYSRLMNTRNKKAYAGLVIMQEGHILEKPDVDIKGLAIRKVSVNKNVREYFTNVLENDVLKTDTIKLSTVAKAFKDLEFEIANSLKNGDVKYLIPAKVNEIDSYKTPFQIQSVRGTIIWNALYPNDEIVMPEKVNLIKLTCTTIDILDNDRNIPSHEYSVIKDTVFGNEHLEKYGFSVICIPKSVKELPKWLIPHIDVKTMTSDNIKSGMIILESLGFNPLNVLGTQFPSNTLQF